MTWEVLALPRRLTRQFGVCAGRCDTEFLNQILTDAAHDQGSAVVQSRMPTRIRNSKDHDAARID